MGKVAIGLFLAITAVWGQTAKNTYILGPDDQIAIRVLDLEEFAEGATGKDRVYRIDLRGQVNLPLIGRLKVSGQTAARSWGAMRCGSRWRAPSNTVAASWR